MKKLTGFKKVYLFVSSAVIFLLHIPFVFAKAKPNTSPAPVNEAGAVVALPAIGIEPAIGGRKSLYDSLRLGSLGMARQAYDFALHGFNFLVQTGKIANQHVISIIDFTKPSSQKRLFVIDLDHYKVLYNTYVAHGMNSGKEYAEAFSNKPESNKSSLGFYSTSSTYIGGNGYSLRLNGLERGVNDNANSRDIVMHGADYVNENYISSQGYIGRSWGCPAVMPQLSRPIIDRIKNGTCLFIFSNNQHYISHSRILNHG